MADDPQFWTLQQSAEIADLWEQLFVAADSGDERARDFLETFEPWARDELGTRRKS